MAIEPGAQPRRDDNTDPHDLNRAAELGAMGSEQEKPESLGVQPDTPIQEAVARLWEMVRTGADLIVTLRQENTMLQSQMTSLKKSEGQLQEQVQEFLTKISELEQGISQEAPGTSIDRLEDKIAELEKNVAEANSELSETKNQLEQTLREVEETELVLGDQEEITQQILQLRADLEERSRLLLDLQQEFASRNITLEPDEERERLQNELDRSLKIIERYRAAGLRHLESPDTENQATLFELSSVETSGMSTEELRQLANKLEGVAKRLEDLFGLS